MSFLEGLIQAKPPLKPFVDAKTNLSVFISLLLPKVHFLKVTRVVTLAPPMKFTPTTQLSGGTFLHGGHTKQNQAFHACWPWRLSLVVSHPKTPILNCFNHLLWSYFVTVSEFSCLAKSYSVWS